MSDTLLFICIGILLAVFGLTAVGVGFFFSKGAAIRRQEEARLQTEGVTTDAEITRKRTVVNARSSNFYYVRYQFQPITTEDTSSFFTRESQVSIPEYNRIKEGDRIVVRYLPDNPAAARVESGLQDSNTSANLGGNGMMFYVVGAIMFALLIIFVVTASNLGHSRP